MVCVIKINGCKAGTCWNTVLDSAFIYLCSMRCQQLEYVDFSGCVRLTDAAMKHLSKCAHLKTVLLNSNELLTDAAGEHLSKSPKYSETLDQNFFKIEETWLETAPVDFACMGEFLSTFESRFKADLHK